MNFIEELIGRLKSAPQHIVLPEGDEPRTLQAANDILKDDIAQLTLLGNVATIESKAKELGLEYIHKASIVDPATAPKRDAYRDLLFELRKNKGMTMEEAGEKVLDPLYFGCLMVKSGDANGYLAGAINTTGNVLRPALQIIKTRPGISCVSGAFLLFTTQPQYGKDGLVIVADCAVTPNPKPEELAQIAVASASTAKALANVEPRVAMLSYSTKGSGKGPDVDKMVEATKLAKELAPELHIDGELQADAALVESVGSLKAPGSAVAGKANVLVFPSLEAGNIGYKLVERLGGALAVGPVLQGIAAPVNDLSRGSSPKDIFNMIVITAGQALAC